MEILLLVIGLVVGAALGSLVVWVLVQRRAAEASSSAVAVEDPALVEARHRQALLEAKVEADAALARALTDEHAAQADLRAKLASVEAQALGLREQIESARTQYRELVERREVEQRERQAREAAESKVLQALAPVKQSLTEMQSKVADLETQRHLQHGELSQQLKTAAESEERLRSTAESLASALRSNSTRGVWGETQLRSVVEAAGLLERVDFDTQHSITTDAGAGRPDMVIHLPGGKHIAVDAKVPFTAYLEASGIPATATGAEGAKREALLKQHVKAVRDHIVALGGKTYWAGLGASPELVIAFIPSESLISSALEADPSLLEFAFSKRVALASPVTLWSVLKTVAFSWQQDVLTSEAKSLFDLSRELYARLSTTAGQIEKLGRTIERTVKDYNSFVGSLESRVLPTARKLKALDETKVFASLEGIEESPRELTAYEFTTSLAAEPPAAIEAGQAPTPSSAFDDSDDAVLVLDPTADSPVLDVPVLDDSVLDDSVLDGSVLDDPVIDDSVFAADIDDDLRSI